MPGTTFDQFRRFSTDAYGLERLLRFVQATVQILISLTANSPIIFDTLATGLSTREVHRPLSELSSRIGLVRRIIRFFRFFDAFSASYTAFTSLSTKTADRKGVNGMPTTPHLLNTLDGLASTFNGLYLLLEATTVVDALGIQGLAILGPELAYAIKIESQRCWLLALVFGALSCILRLSRIAGATSAAPMSGKSAKSRVEADEDSKAQGARTAAQQARVARKLVACLLDLPLPGSVVGWIPASEGSIGLLMLTTSVLTGFDVWERCGKEVGKT